MSSPEPFNFGRRIKDLKRNYNKTYADLTSALKISRERIIQLEENEREPTELERRRFAEYYSLPPEELGLFGGGTGQPLPRPAAPSIPPSPMRPTRPTGGYPERAPYSQPQAPYGDRPGYGNTYGGGSGGGNYEQPPRSGNYDSPPPAERRYGGGGNYPERSNNYDRGNERGGNYADRGNNYDRGNERGGNYPDRGNYNDRGGNFNDRGNYNDRGGNFQQPRGGSNFNDRGGNFQQPRGGSNFNDRGGNFQQPRSNFQQPRTGGGRGTDELERPARPAKPKPKPKPADNGEPKPVMKYTAEQLGDIESAYLRKQRDLKVPLKFTFMNGEEYTGVVIDFTPFTVHIVNQENGEEMILRKLAMAYYRKADAMEEARNERAAAEGGGTRE
ncbi:MAG TPA: hypothetical protein VH186_07135 [Chloroflexia bacterium]|nr:hypothetical protein [Chloroflexia bacterium]